jgi:uncharacterized protein YqeY
MINIDELIKVSILNKNTVKTKVFRELKSEILKFKTQKNAPEYTDSEEIKLIVKIIKTHEESIEAYKSANRDDLVASELEEIEILSSLIPKASDQKNIINALEVYLLSKYNELSFPKKEMGIVIKYLKEKFPVNDGKELSEIVKKYIQ